MKTNKQLNKKTIEVKFFNCDNAGENIKALVNYFTGNILGDFILEQAIIKVKENNKKIDDYKKSLLEVA